MPPIREYMCNQCGHQFEEIRSIHETETTVECPHCETSTAELLPSAVGGYSISGNNSASTRPKQAGAFKREKK